MEVKTVNTVGTEYTVEEDPDVIEDHTDEICGESSW